MCDLPECLLYNMMSMEYSPTQKFAPTWIYSVSTPKLTGFLFHYFSTPDTAKESSIQRYRRLGNAMNYLEDHVI